MKALIIVDMLNDFVDGKLANPKAQAITPPLQRLLAHAREDGCGRFLERRARRERSGDEDLGRACDGRRSRRAGDR